MSQWLRVPSDVATNAPLRVPTSTRTLLIPHSFPSRWPDVLGVVSSIPIMVPNPGHRVGQGVFVAALRHEVEIVVGADQDVQPARIGRIGVEDVVVLVLVED